MDTPWGEADFVEELAEGIYLVSTPSHGGFKLSEERNAQIPEAFRREDGWYEEDVDALIVMYTFYDVCRKHYADISQHDLLQWMKDWLPDEYEKAFGIKVYPEESRVLRQRAFEEQHKNDFIVVAAWGDWYPTVPRGMVGVAAARGGNRAGPFRYFLVPAEEYKNRPMEGFVVDLGRHYQWKEPPNV